MITEKGKFSTKMKAKGVKLGNVHTFVSILCFEFFIVWKSSFHKINCVSRCQGTENNTEPRNKILFNHALEYGNSSHFLSKIWWDELVTNTQSLTILVPDLIHVLTSIWLIRIWHKFVVYVVSFSCIIRIHFLFNTSSAVSVYSSTYSNT